MLEQLYTSNKSLTVVSTPYFMTYIKFWDAMVLFNGALGVDKPLEKIFRDGTQCQIGTYKNLNIMGSRSGGRVFWQTAGICYGADEITAQPNYNEVLNPSWTIPSELRRCGDFIDDSRGLFIHAAFQGGTSYMDVYRLSDGERLRRLGFPGKPQFTGLALAGEAGRLLGHHAASGYAALADYLSGRGLWESNLGVCRLATYDLAHDLVITLGTDNKTRIFLLSAVPAVLSAPEFYPAAAEVERYVGYPVRARLLGADGEPSAGYRVDWVLPTLGALARHQSLTDAEGYAENFYYAGQAGEDTLEVRAVI